jgi:hypothetical protein
VATAAPLYLAVMRRLATAGGARLSNPKLSCRGDAGA